MAYYYQRQSNIINHYSEHVARYYSNTSAWLLDYIVPDFIDLTQNNSINELKSVVKESDIVVYHATRNYNKPLVCSDGVFDIKQFVKNKKVFVLIHGQPETRPSNIKSTVDFINRYRKDVKFLVATPNQLRLFPHVVLFPIVGLFSADDSIYQKSVNSVDSDIVRSIRRSEWKAKLFLKEMMHIMKVNTLGEKIKLFSSKARHIYRKNNKLMIGEQCSLIKKLILNDSSLVIDKKIYHSNLDGLSIECDNRCFWQRHEIILNDLKNTDILLENDITDYPAGGTSHTIGHEAMCMGVTVLNGMTVDNSRTLANWLGTDELPPFPNWLNERDFNYNYKVYLKKLIFDRDFLAEKQQQSREYFVKYMDVDNTLPRLLEILES